MPALRGDEEWPGNDLPMHQRLGRGDIGPFENLQSPTHSGPPPHQALEIEAGQIGAVEMMTDMHVPYTFEGRVAGTGNEIHDLPGDGVGPMRGEQGLMRRFMDQVRGEDHAVGTEQHAGDDQYPRVRTHERNRAEPTAAGPREHQ